MADDSTPLPFPNIKIPQWHYQITHVERLKEEAGEKFWKGIEEDGECHTMSMRFEELERSI